MAKRALKIGLLARGFKSGTGPGAYLAAVQKAMSGRHLLCRLDGPCGLDLDLVHVIDAKRVRLSLLDSIRAPLLLDFHDDYWADPAGFPSFDRLFRRIRNKQLFSHHLRALGLARGVVVHSRSVERSFLRVLESIPAEKKPALHLVHYGVEAGEPAPASADHPLARAENKNEAKIILLVGRDMFRKGLATIIQALPRVRKSQAQARLVVIGDDYAHARLAARIMARGLPVTFMPGQAREKLREWYGRASVLVLPSWQEAFGLVLIEAMAAGLPVVAARIGGIPEAVEDEVSGLLHQPGNAVELAAKISAVLGDPELRSGLVAAGKERARAFSGKLMALDLERVYCSVLEER